ncbi:MAG: hypothetical protein KBG84_15920 [Planctomycetes bacterium]|nr:hypothetical protein [Planctomycetota bacterium]
MNWIRAMLVVPFLCLGVVTLVFADGKGSGTAEKPAEPDPIPRKWTFGQLGAALRDDLTFDQANVKDKDGKQIVFPGDKLLEWNGKKLSTLDDFCRALYASKPGEDVTLKIARPTKADPKKFDELTVAARLGDPKKNFADLYYEKDKRKRGYDWNKHSEAAFSQNALRRRIDGKLEEYKLEGAWDNLLAAHERELDLWDCNETLSSAELLMRDPCTSQAYIEESTNAIAGAMSDESAGLWQLYVPVAKLLDVQPNLRPQGSDWPQAEAGMPSTEADTWRLKKALAALDSRPSLRQQPNDAAWGDLTKRVQNIELAWQGDPKYPDLVALVKAARDQELQGVDVLARVDRALEVLIESYDWHDRGVGGIGGMGKAATEARERAKRLREQGILLQYETPFGMVGIGKDGPSRWDCESNKYALILDLGGDDTYEGYVAAPSGPGNPVSVIIDLGGNDHYRSTHKFGLASGACGTGILYDVAGDDTYECAEWGIGCAFCGVGLLIDKAGDDKYIGGDMTIGCAAYGVGAVIDFAGNDVYESHVYSVGVGFPKGVGLVLDKRGDDRYRCTGKYQSGYGTEGEWQGWGIGCGFGFRSLAGGGIGTVVDCAGNDVYDAGEFGLGCGYFLGVGMVRDVRGNDIYRASRYGLAAAAHCAVGLFMDDRGNDDYQNIGPASMGGVWDIVVGAMFDLDGNDSYRSGGLGLGACSQNGVGIFWDAIGNDSYRAYDASTIGHGAGTNYGGGRLAKNFGFFWDTGGQDDYTRGDRKNAESKLTGEYGIFTDE